jgi:TonB-dependent SusC/RagA subfamily outer membrane receptor
MLNKPSFVYLQLFYRCFLLFGLLAATQAKAAGRSPDHVYQSPQQVKVVRGNITDSVGPVAGVTVTVKGVQRRGMASDADGKFFIEVSGENPMLVFSMVGYITMEVPVTGRDVIDVKMRAADKQLTDVVVVGFGTQKRTDMVGSVTSIKPSDLKVPSSNLTTALAGRAAGVIAYQRSGEPGQDNAEFFIRGVTTFGYRTAPLILIDGIELTTTDLARLQPDDIASFSILKDATSTAVYGARGANGIILVTTKQGKEGKVKVGIRIENSLSQPTKNVELADPVTYMKMANEAVRTRDPLGTLLYSEEKIAQTLPAAIHSFTRPTTGARSCSRTLPPAIVFT